MDQFPPFITRDEEEEELVQQVIYHNARPDEIDDDNADKEELISQFLNDSGEGLESEERRDEEVSLTNSDKVFIMAMNISVDALIYLYCS